MIGLKELLGSSSHNGYLGGEIPRWGTKYIKTRRQGAVVYLGNGNESLMLEQMMLGLGRRMWNRGIMVQQHVNLEMQARLRRWVNMTCWNIPTYGHYETLKFGGREEKSITWLMWGCLGGSRS